MLTATILINEKTPNSHGGEECSHWRNISPCGVPPFHSLQITGSHQDEMFIRFWKHVSIILENTGVNPQSSLGRGRSQDWHRLKKTKQNNSYPKYNLDKSARTCQGAVLLVAARFPLARHSLAVLFLVLDNISPGWNDTGLYFILRNTSLGGSGTGVGSSATTEITESFMSPSCRVNCLALNLLIFAGGILSGASESDQSVENRGSTIRASSQSRRIDAWNRVAQRHLRLSLPPVRLKFYWIRSCLNSKLFEFKALEFNDIEIDWIRIAMPGDAGHLTAAHIHHGGYCGYAG